MDFQNLKTPSVEGIIIGLIATIVSIGLHIPLVFSITVGIIFSVVAFFILSENKNER